MQQTYDETFPRVTLAMRWARGLIEESRQLCKEAEHKLASSRQAIAASREIGEPRPTRRAFYPGALSR